jgi:hypothetical protein
VVRVGSDAPTLLLGVRDEFVSRAWEPPARHWERWPVVGGRDLLAGGTWLALEPDERRVACVLNARGPQAPAEGRLSRGDLPLRAASGGMAVLLGYLGDPRTRGRYDPFHIVCADQDATTMVTWDGADLSRIELGPGTHLLTNAGLAYSEGRTRTDEPRAAYFGPRFAEQPLWKRWRELAGGDGLPVDDPRALVVRRSLEDGRTWGTTSVSLVAVAAGGVRYEFQDAPGDTGAWRTIIQSA